MSISASAERGEAPDALAPTPPAVAEASQALHALGLEDMVEEVVSRVVGSHLREHLVETTQASDESVLEAALQYSETVPLHFLSLVVTAAVSSLG